MENRSVNLVFQGGGVRGIAYAGVLSTMPEWLRITGVGGTSAGALVAAFLAIVSLCTELREILSYPALFTTSARPYATSGYLFPVHQRSVQLHLITCFI